jgi:metallo-beta-lactamase class B
VVKSIRAKLLVMATLALCSSNLFAEGDNTVTLTRVRGRVYVAVDQFPLSDENSVVFVGDQYVTVVGTTWTPSTAHQLAAEIAKMTNKPIEEVINTNDNLDRAGGNAYFKSIGARIVSTTLTHDLMQRDWNVMVADARKSLPQYPAVPLVMPDTTYPGDFTLQGGRVRGIYLGPSHAQDDIFVYFPDERILYAGCILKEQLGNLALADLTEYPKTLQKLKHLHLGYQTIIAGHWSPIHGPELVDQYLRLLRDNRQDGAGN